MAMPGGEKRSLDLNHQLTLIINQCNVAKDRLRNNQYADITFSLLLIKKALIDCQCVVFMCDKE